MSKIVAIIQARTDSTRLPNKVMADIFGKPLIIRLLERVKESTTINEIILATTTRAIDTSLVNVVRDYGLPVFRGKCNDVLDRYYKAATKYHADGIVRITGDCPLIDPQIVDKVIQLFLQNQYDYVTNTLEPTYPDGLDVELFSYAALQKAWSEAFLGSDREHVTPYIRNHPEKFSLKNMKNTIDLSHLRWTVDQQEDLEFVREIFKRLYNERKIFYMKDIIELLQEHPELKGINTGIKRNEGYIRSLKYDKKQLKD
jgi:spore coat polysaccharide biosynthesis protein SpsF